MTWFKCITQTLHMQSFMGPSGQRYSSLQNYPFKVDNEEDVSFFRNNKRFLEEGVQRKTGVPQIIPKKTPEEEFCDILELIEGLQRKTIKILRDQFKDMDSLIEHLITGGNLPEEISEKQKNLLLKYLETGDD